MRKKQTSKYEKKKSRRNIPLIRIFTEITLSIHRIFMHFPTFVIQAVPCIVRIRTLREIVVCT